MQQEHILAAAKEYCDSGVRIFVVQGKKPVYTGWQERATNDFEKIRLDIEANDGCGLAIPTGVANGFDVWDIDGEEGAEQLRQWVEDGNELPVTPVVLTGSGGYHFYFKHEPGLRNSAKQMMAGWDTRGDGGYVVAPPSLHPDTGRPYMWFDFAAGAPTEFPGGIFAARPAAWPEALLELYIAGKGKRRTEIEAGGEIPLGVQEDTLTSMAGTMRRIGMTSDEIASALIVVARERCNPPMPEVNALRIAHSIGDRDAGDVLMIDELTDRGWGRRLAAYAGERAAWVSEAGAWAVWNGQRWKLGIPKQTTSIQSVWDGLVNTMMSQARALPDDTQSDKEIRLALMEYSGAGRSSRTMGIGIEQAKRFMEVSKEVFDEDPWLFNVSNGTLDLRTGQLSTHAPGDKITKLSDVDFVPGVRAPKWEKFIDQITEGDKELARYIQRVVGYTMSGSNDEQLLAIVYGRGGTGKSTFMRILSHVFGEYHETASQGVFLLNKDDGGPKPGIAKLVGTRLVAGIEINNGRQLDEALVKGLTGNEAISTRTLYQTEFTFTPQFTIWLTANDMPDVTASDSMFRRIRAIPIDRPIPVEERNRYLVEEIVNDRSEVSGILNWCLEGCLAWQTEGLGTTKKVEETTLAYKKEMNPVASWIDENCEFDPEAFIVKNVGWQSYYGWYRFQGLGQTSNREFSKHLRMLGYETSKTMRVEGEVVRVIPGLRLKIDTSSAFTKMTRE